MRSAGAARRLGIVVLERDGKRRHFFALFGHILRAFMPQERQQPGRRRGGKWQRRWPVLCTIRRRCLQTLAERGKRSMDQPNFDRADEECNRIARGSILGDDALVTPEQFAVILACSVRKLAKLRKEERLPQAIRLAETDGLVRWHLAVIRKWIRAGCRYQTC